MATPPIPGEISLKNKKRRRSKSFPECTSADSNLNEQQKDQELPPKATPPLQNTNIKPKSNPTKQYPKKPVRRVKSLRRNRVAGIMSRSGVSGISSLTTWTGSRNSFDDSTASVVPVKPQDIFRSKSPPRNVRATTPKATIRKQEVAVTGTPQRMNSAAPTNDATPVRNNRATPNTPAPTPKASPTTTSASIPLPASYSISCNESLSTNNSSIMGNITKRAVDNVLDNLLFEDDMEDYSVKSMVKDEEVDSYFDEEKTAADEEKSVLTMTDAANSPTKKQNFEETIEVPNTVHDVKVTNSAEKRRFIPERPEVETVLDDDSYFDRDMDVSSLALEDAVSTLEREQGVASDHWHFNVRSLRHKKDDTKNNEYPSIDVSGQEEESKLGQVDANESTLSDKMTLSEVQSISPGSICSIPPLPNEPEIEASIGESEKTNVQDNALLSPHQYEDVSLGSNKSKGLVVAVGTVQHRSSASWWQDDDDEETGIIQPRCSNKTVKSIDSEEEPFTLRKTFMILFVIVGVAAITGGIAALLTSQHQKKQNNEEPNVKVMNPPRITPPPSPQSTPSETLSPPTLLPTTHPKSESATTVTTKRPSSQPAEATPTASRPSSQPKEAMPTASPTVADTPAPTIDHLKLSLYERIELLSPESFPALHNDTSPQAQALEWALQQPEPSLAQYSLATLYFSSTDDWTTDDGWLKSPSVCDWYGIVCRNDKVTEITLSFNNLVSTLPDELSLLTDLQVLSISGAAGIGNVKGGLTGSIPATWGERLVNLVALELYDNQLTGQLPSTFQYLTDLEMLYLDGNQFWGPLPTELGALTNLDILDLSNNDFSGDIPTEAGLWTNLVNLRLHDNEFTGFIPTELGNIKPLKELHIQNNVLMGTAPQALYSLSNLKWIDFSGNELNGILPPSIGLLSSIEGLLLSDNRFIGTIPVQLYLLANLRVLDLSRNLITGTVPSQLGLLGNLTTLLLDTNLLQETVPDEICDNQTLREFTFSADCTVCKCCTKCLDNN